MAGTQRAMDTRHTVALLARLPTLFAATTGVPLPLPPAQPGGSGSSSSGGRSSRGEGAGGGVGGAGEEAEEVAGIQVGCKSWRRRRLACATAHCTL